MNGETGEMNIHKKQRQLLVVQVDSITGETAGGAVSVLYEAGAKNVQIVSTVTKKNRPGWMFFIDVDEEARPAVERAMVRELGVTGWHRLPGEHCYIDTEIVSKTVRVRLTGKNPRNLGVLSVERKVSSADPEVIRPEFDSCEKLRRMLRDAGVEISRALAEQKIIEAFGSCEEEPVLEFKG